MTKLLVISVKEQNLNPEKIERERTEHPTHPRPICLLGLMVGYIPIGGSKHLFLKNLKWRPICHHLGNHKVGRGIGRGGVTLIPGLLVKIAWPC